jgi:hypothetical protein
VIRGRTWVHSGPRCSAGRPADAFAHGLNCFKLNCFNFFKLNCFKLNCFKLKRRNPNCLSMSSTLLTKILAQSASEGNGQKASYRE